MAAVELDAQPLQAYAALEKAGDVRLLDAIDDALDLLEADPGDARARRRSFGGGRWGIPAHDRSEDWLVVWERDLASTDMVVVRYLGADPFA